MTPLDLSTIAYAMVSLVILLLRFRSGGDVLPLVCLAAVMVVAVLAPKARRAGPMGSFIGEFYPVLLTIALYNEVGMSNRAAGATQDTLVQQWEQVMFGGQPSLHWMSAWPNPVVSSIFHLSYLAFYLIVIGTPLVLWISGRKAAAERSILLMMITFYISYTIFRLFPVAGPRFLFPLQETPAIHAMIPAFAHRLVAGGSAWGTAFPSSHVAVAFVNAGSAWRGWRAFGVVVWIVAILLAFGTVYGQFHYAVDALAGAGLAVGVLLFTGMRKSLPGTSKV